MSKLLSSIKLDQSTPYLLALDGGVSSMLLLHVLVTSGYNITALHIRSDESTADAEIADFCREMCNEYKIELLDPLVLLPKGRRHYQRLIDTVRMFAEHHTREVVWGATKDREVIYTLHNVLTGHLWYDNFDLPRTWHTPLIRYTTEMLERVGDEIGIEWLQLPQYDTGVDSLQLVVDSFDQTTQTQRWKKGLHITNTRIVEMYEALAWRVERMVPHNDDHTYNRAELNSLFHPNELPYVVLELMKRKHNTPRVLNRELDLIRELLQVGSVGSAQLSNEIRISVQLLTITIE